MIDHAMMSLDFIYLEIIVVMKWWLDWCHEMADNVSKLPACDFVMILITVFVYVLYVFY